MRICATVPASAYDDHMGYIHEGWARRSFTRYRIGVEALAWELFAWPYTLPRELRRIDWEGDT